MFLKGHTFSPQSTTLAFISFLIYFLVGAGEEGNGTAVLHWQYEKTAAPGLCIIGQVRSAGHGCVCRWGGCDARIRLCGCIRNVRTEDNCRSVVHPLRHVAQALYCIKT